MDSESKLRREVRVLAVGLVVLAIVVGVLARRMTNPPDPQEVVITDATGAERIILTCQGGVPSVTMYDEAANQACSASVVKGVAQFAVGDGTAVRYIYPENVRREELKRSASE